MNNYDKFSYTMVNVPITLKKCISDYDDIDYLIDIDCDSFSQQNCYVGEQFITEMQINRIKKGEVVNGCIEPQWQVELIVRKGKTEEEVIKIVEDLCEILSFNVVQNNTYIQNHGVRGFDFRPVDIRRRYAKKDKLFGVEDIVGKVMVLQKELKTITKDVFNLPQTNCKCSDFLENLKDAYMKALEGKDVVSRYILLYHMFEIIYKSHDYQKIKSDLEKEHQDETAKESCCKNKKNNNKKRSEILLCYLHSINLYDYISFTNTVALTNEKLFDIITTRNDLAHRADLSKVSKVLYNDMLPILRKILILLNEKETKCHDSK